MFRQASVQTSPMYKMKHFFLNPYNNNQFRIEIFSQPNETSVNLVNSETHPQMEHKH